jgi:hypothetical protein
MKSSTLRWVGNVAYKGAMGNVNETVIGKVEGNGPLRRPRHTRQDNIKMDLKERGCNGVKWILLVQDKDSYEYSNKLSGSRKCRRFLKWLSNYELLKDKPPRWRQVANVMKEI